MYLRTSTQFVHDNLVFCVGVLLVTVSEFTKINIIIMSIYVNITYMYYIDPSDSLLQLTCHMTQRWTPD